MAPFLVKLCTIATLMVASLSGGASAASADMKMINHGDMEEKMVNHGDMVEEMINHGDMEEKVVMLSFYMRMVIENKRSKHYTTVLSARPPHRDGLGVGFGRVYTFDNPLTVRPSLKSHHVGKMQGWSGQVTKNGNTSLLLVQTANLHVNVNSTTVRGRYVDSAALHGRPRSDSPMMMMQGSLSFVGSVPVSLPIQPSSYSEASSYSKASSYTSNPSSYSAVPVVGGTGDFAFARGLAQVRLALVAFRHNRVVYLFHYRVMIRC